MSGGYHQELSTLRKYRDGKLPLSTDSFRKVKNSHPEPPKEVSAASKRRNSIRPQQIEEAKVSNDDTGSKDTSGQNLVVQHDSREDEDGSSKEEVKSTDRPHEEISPNQKDQSVITEKMSPITTSKEQHDRLSATVQILMETLQEQGALRALLEHASSPEEILSVTAEDGMRFRGTLLELEKTVQKLVSVRTELENEKKRSARAERALQITLDQLHDTDSQLREAKAEIKALKEAHQVRTIVKDDFTGSSPPRDPPPPDIPPPPPSPPPPEDDLEASDLDDKPLGERGDDNDVPTRGNGLEEPAQEDDSGIITLDIDLGNDKKGSIRVSLAADPMTLAYEFVQVHSLSTSYVEPLVQYIQKTKDALEEEAKQAERSKPHVRGDSSQEKDRLKHEAPGDAKQSSLETSSSPDSQRSSVASEEPETLPPLPTSDDENSHSFDNNDSRDSSTKSNASDHRPVESLAEDSPARSRAPQDEEISKIFSLIESGEITSTEQLRSVMEQHFSQDLLESSSDHDDERPHASGSDQRSIGTLDVSASPASGISDAHNSTLFGDLSSSRFSYDVEYGTDTVETCQIREDWDDKSEKSRASSRNSGATAESRGSSYYELSQNSSSLSKDDSSVGKDELLSDDDQTSASNKEASYFDDSLEYTESYPCLGDSQRSTDTLDGLNSSESGGVEEATPPSHHKRASAMRHQRKAKRETSAKLRSPIDDSSSGHGSVAKALSSRAAQLDPLEAAVEIFDSATTMANDGCINDAVPLYLHALKIFENYSYDELPMIREEIWKWVSIADVSPLTNEIEDIIAANKRSQARNIQPSSPKSEVDRLVSKARRDHTFPSRHNDNEGPILTVSELNSPQPANISNDKISRTQRRSTSKPDVSPHLSRPGKAAKPRRAAAEDVASKVSRQPQHHEPDHRHEHGDDDGDEQVMAEDSSTDEERVPYEEVGQVEATPQPVSRTQRRSTSKPDVSPHLSRPGKAAKPRRAAAEDVASKVSRQPQHHEPDHRHEHGDDDGDEQVMAEDSSTDEERVPYEEVGQVEATPQPVSRTQRRSTSKPDVSPHLSRPGKAAKPRRAAAEDVASKVSRQPQHHEPDHRHEHGDDDGDEQVMAEDSSTDEERVPYEEVGQVEATPQPVSRTQRRSTSKPDVSPHLSRPGKAAKPRRAAAEDVASKVSRQPQHHEPDHRHEHGDDDGDEQVMAEDSSTDEERVPYEEVGQVEATPQPVSRTQRRSTSKPDVSPHLSRPGKAAKPRRAAAEDVASKVSRQPQHHEPDHRHEHGDDDGDEQVMAEDSSTDEERVPYEEVGQVEATPQPVSRTQRRSTSKPDVSPHLSRPGKAAKPRRAAAEDVASKVSRQPQHHEPDHRHEHGDDDGDEQVMAEDSSTDEERVPYEEVGQVEATPQPVSRTQRRSTSKPDVSPHLSRPGKAAKPRRAAAEDVASKVSRQPQHHEPDHRHEHGDDDGDEQVMAEDSSTDEERVPYEEVGQVEATPQPVSRTQRRSTSKPDVSPHLSRPGKAAKPRRAAAEDVASKVSRQPQHHEPDHRHEHGDDDGDEQVMAEDSSTDEERVPYEEVGQVEATPQPVSRTQRRSTSKPDVSPHLSRPGKAAKPRRAAAEDVASKVSRQPQHHEPDHRHEHGDDDGDEQVMAEDSSTDEERVPYEEVGQVEATPQPVSRTQRRSTSKPDVSPHLSRPGKAAKPRRAAAEDVASKVSRQPQHHEPDHRHEHGDDDGDEQVMAEDSSTDEERVPYEEVGQVEATPQPVSRTQRRSTSKPDVSPHLSRPGKAAKPRRAAAEDVASKVSRQPQHHEPDHRHEHGDDDGDEQVMAEDSSTDEERVPYEEVGQVEATPQPVSRTQRRSTSKPDVSPHLSRPGKAAKPRRAAAEDVASKVSRQPQHHEPDHRHEHGDDDGDEQVMAEDSSTDEERVPYEEVGQVEATPQPVSRTQRRSTSKPDVSPHLSRPGKAAKPRRAAAEDVASKVSRQPQHHEPDHRHEHGDDDGDEQVMAEDSSTDEERVPYEEVGQVEATPQPVSRTQRRSTSKPDVSPHLSRPGKAAKPRRAAAEDVASKVSRQPQHHEPDHRHEHGDDDGDEQVMAEDSSTDEERVPYEEVGQVEATPQPVSRTQRRSTSKPDVSPHLSRPGKAAKPRRAAAEDVASKVSRQPQHHEPDHRHEHGDDDGDEQVMAEDSSTDEERVPYEEVGQVEATPQPVSRTQRRSTSKPDVSPHLSRPGKAAKPRRAAAEDVASKVPRQPQHHEPDHRHEHGDDDGDEQVMAEDSSTDEERAPYEEVGQVEATPQPVSRTQRRSTSKPDVSPHLSRPGKAAKPRRAAAEDVASKVSRQPQHHEPDHRHEHGDDDGDEQVMAEDSSTDEERVPYEEVGQVEATPQPVSRTQRRSTSKPDVSPHLSRPGKAAKPRRAAAEDVASKVSRQPQHHEPDHRHEHGDDDGDEQVMAEDSSTDEERVPYEEVGQVEATPQPVSRTQRRSTSKPDVSPHLSRPGKAAKPRRAAAEDVASKVSRQPQHHEPDHRHEHGDDDGDEQVMAEDSSTDEERVPYEEVGQVEATPQPVSRTQRRSTSKPDVSPHLSRPGKVNRSRQDKVDLL